MSWEREEWESGPPEDKSERLQGIRHLNEPDYCPYESNFLCIFYPCENTKKNKINCRTKVVSSSRIVKEETN